MKLLQALRNNADTITSSLENSKLFDHRGDRGEFRERVIEAFLRPFLPECYGIGSGQVFSADGQSSRQIDVVFYDAVFSNILFKNEQNSLFTAESVYGTMEVKSYLSSDDLRTSVENIFSVKSLPRAPSHMGDVTPTRRLDVKPPLSMDRRQRNAYIGAVFAYDGICADSVSAALNEWQPVPPMTKELLPDAVFCYRRGYTILRTFQGQFAWPGEVFDAFTAVKTGRDTLPLMFLTLNMCLNNTFLRAPDLWAYWRQVVDSIQSE